MTSSKIQPYSRRGLWSLFLMCAFPLHFWTLLLAFRDISWLTERSNLWDAIGVASYGLIFAFVESLVVFFVAALLGLLLVSTKWEEPQRIALLSLMVLILSMWAMYGQAHFIWKLTPASWILQLAAQSGHPYRYIFGIKLVEVSLTIAIPAFLLLCWEKFFRFTQDAIDRLSLLTSLYLFLDILGLVIVVIRNI